MPDNQPQTPQFNPLAEFKQAWPNAKLSDGDILKGLQDPAKFRSAFPHYTGVTDDEIRQKMQQYSPLDQPAKPQGDTRPSVTPAAMQSFIGPRQPSLMQRMGNVVAPFMEHIRGQQYSQVNVGQPRSEGLIAPEQAMTAQEREQHPVAAATGEFAGGLTSGGNIALIAGTAGLGEAAPALSKALGFTFSAQMLNDAVNQYPELKQAWQEGDSNKVLYHLTHMVESGAFGVHMATEGMNTDPRTRYEALKENQRLDRLKQSDPAAHARQREAGQYLVNATPMGPRDSSVQNTQLDFTSKTPDAAHQPHDTATSKVANVERPAPVGLPHPDDLAEAMIQKGMDPATAYSAAAQRVEAASGQGNWQGVERRAAQQLIDQYGGLERRGVPDALVAPRPTDYVGAETPVPLTRFPKSAIENLAVGRTLGVDKVDINAPAPAAKISVDSNGLKWAEDANGVRVTVPKRIADADVQDYAKQKLAEQVKMRTEGGVGEVQELIKQQKAQAVAKPTYPGTIEQVMTNLPLALDKLAKLGRDADLAENDDLSGKLSKDKQDVEDRIHASVRDNLASKDRGFISSFIADVKDRATKLEAKAKFIRDQTDHTIKNRGLTDDLTDLRGGKLGNHPLYLGKEKGEDVLGEEDAGGHIVKPEDALGLNGRALLNTLQGRVSSREFAGPSVVGKPEGAPTQEFADYVAKLQQERPGLAGKISEVVKAAAQEGHSLEDLMDQGLKEYIDRLKFIDDELRKYAGIPGGKATGSVGRRPNAPLKLDENGVPQDLAPLQLWSHKMAEAVLEQKLRTIPTDEEFYQHADMRNEKARVLRSLADTADGLLKRAGERGALGEPGPKGAVKPSSLYVPQANDIIARARAKGLTTFKVTDKTVQTGNTGFLVLNDRGEVHWIDAGDKTHSARAEQLYPNLAHSIRDTALDAVLNSPGVIRKGYRGIYETRHIADSKIQDAISDDLVRDRMTNRPTRIDTRLKSGMPFTIQVEPGWENFGEAVGRSLRRQNLGEQGAAPAIHLAAGAAGMVAGAHLGMAAGGPVGAAAGGAIGFFVGFEAPAVLTSPNVVKAIPFIHSLAQRANLSVSEYFRGPAQIKVNGDSAMDAIRQAQDMHQSRGTTWITRLRSLPAGLARGFDPYVRVADKVNFGYLHRALTYLGDTKTPFNSLNLPDNQSFYMALRDSLGKAYGMRHDMMTQYQEVNADAHKAGLADALVSHLNYLGYARTFKVLDEHMQDLQSKMQDAQQSLQNPNNTVRENIAFQDKIKELQKYHDQIQDKIKNGEAAPGGYTPQSLQQAHQTFEQNLGPQKAAELKKFSDRVFNARAHILDLVHDKGLITDEAYQTYKQRGPEYIPMERIVDDLADSKVHTSAQPLHLRQQTVIKTLEGSMRTNVSPWEAFAHADGKAFSQIIRNDTMKSGLDLAKQYPAALGAEFKKVGNDYRARAGEMLVGHYDGGKPELYAVPEYIGDVLNRYPAATKTALGAVARFWAASFKGTATVYNLGFQVASAMGHMSSGLTLSDVNSRDVGRYFKSWGSSVKSVLMKDAVYRETARSGALFGNFQSLIDPEYNVSPQKFGLKKDSLGFGKILHSMGDAAAAIENVGRVATYRNARLDGHNMEAAAQEAKYRGGAPDFSRAMGDISQPLNHVVMFLNAHLQYGKQMMDAVRRNPARMGGTLLATAAMGIALANWNAQQKDSNGDSLLNKVPMNERLRNWTVLLPYTHTDPKTGAELPVRINIPKSYTAQFMTNPVEAAAYNVLGKENKTGEQQAQGTVNAFSKYGKEDRTNTQQVLDTLGSMSPIPMRLQEGRIGETAATSLISSMHPLAKTAIQQYANRDDFGYPIVPQAEQGIEPQEQYGPHTTATAKAIGRGGVKGSLAAGAVGAASGGVMGGIPGAVAGGVTGAAYGATPSSPRRTDAALRSLFAGGATQTESYLNPFFEANTATTGSKQSLIDSARNTPVVGPAITRFMGSNMDQSMATAQTQFYNAAEAAQTPIKTVQFLTKNRPQEVPAYLQQHEKDLFLGVAADKIRQALSKIDAAQKEVANLPPESQETTAKFLYEQKKTMLKIGNEMLRSSYRPGQTEASPGQGTGNAR